MTPTLSPQQREEVLEAMDKAALEAARSLGPLSHRSPLERRINEATLDAALPAIIGAVLEGPFASRFVIEYLERETGVPFGDMIGRDDKDRIRALAEEAR